LPDFLVNDTFDANFYPDTLYFSDGTTAPVNVVTDATPDGLASVDDLEVAINASVEAGWTYLRLVDPADGKFQIASILRDDGLEITPHNLWRTDRTFPANGRPIYENILHLLDYHDTSGSYTYTLIYEQDGPTITDIVDVTPDPRTTAVNAITVEFSEAINPQTFTATDITLTLDSITNLSTDTLTVLPLSATRYQITRLDSLTHQDGTYQLTVNATGIEDLSGNFGVGTLSETWIKSASGDADITPPTFTKAPKLLLNPRNIPVSSLDVTFSEPIDVSSFTWEDITLTVNNGDNLITDSVTISAINDTVYRIKGLSPLTNDEGTYTLTIQGSGIQDLSGNPGTENPSETWIIDRTPPAAPTNLKIGNTIIPTGQLVPLETAPVIRINTTTPTISGTLGETGLRVYIYDKRLNQSLGQAIVTDNQFNTVIPLVAPGSQELEIQVIDAAGNITRTAIALFADVTQPAILEVLNVPDSPTIEPVNYLDVRFSEPINLATFDSADLTLIRNGSTVDLASITVESLSDNTYRINGLTDVTSTPGTYQLTINSITIEDRAGNTGLSSTPVSFTILPEAIPGITLIKSCGCTSIPESTPDHIYEIVLDSQPTANVVINILTDDQIDTSPLTLTFTPDNWNIPQTVTVDIIDDTLPEGLHTSTIAHTVTSDDADYNAIAVESIPVTIEDDDAEIIGQVWNDSNGDGVNDATEIGLSNWKVYLDSNNNQQLDDGEVFLETDENGNYHFTNLRPNTYSVAQVVEEGWQQTYPVVEVSTTASNAAIYIPNTPLITEEAISTTAANSLINLDEFWADSRFSHIKGQGYTTVIIDTGIDLDHPFFGVNSNNDGISDRILYQYDFADNDNDATDVNNHGSHVASIIASEDDTYTGIAPATDLIVLKVFSDSGSGYFSDLEEALQWVVSNADTYNVASVNLSLGDEQNWVTNDSHYGVGDELAALAHQDIIVTAAAGNSYYSYNGIPGLAYPAIDPNTIAVGAVWAENYGDAKTFSDGAIDYTTDSDRIASFSQRHPTFLDVFAPGILITAANATGGIITLGGTSQAAPYLTGIAVLAQQIAQESLGRFLTVNEFRTLLNTTSMIINDGDDENDNVINTGEDYYRADLLALAEEILTLDAQTPSSDPINLGEDNTDNVSVPSSTTIPVVHTITLNGGDVVTDIDFGNQELNQPPDLVTNEPLLLDEGDTQVINSNHLLITDPDNTNNEIVYILTDIPDHGSLILDGVALMIANTFSQYHIDNDRLTYTHDGSETIYDSFSFTVNDGEDGNISETLFDITVNSVNDLPDAQDDVAETNEDIPITIYVLANDLDVDSDILTILTVTQTLHGAVTINPDNTLTYSPSLNFNGSDSFTYTVDDGNGGTDIATVTLTVIPVNDAPVAIEDRANTDEDNSLIIDATILLANDSDVDNDSLTLTEVDGTATTGIVTLDGLQITYNPNGQFEFLPFGDTATDTFSYTIEDGNEGIATATVTVTIMGVNDPATIRGTATTAVTEDTDVDSNGYLNATGLLTVTDPDAGEDKFSTTVTSANGNLGSLSITEIGEYIYSVDNNLVQDFAVGQTKTETFIVSSVDGTATQEITITINGINDAPMVSANVASQTVDYSDRIQQVLFTATDIDSPIANLTATFAYDYQPINGFYSGSFTNGLPDAGTVSGGLSDSFDEVSDSEKSWLLSGIADLAPGNYKIKATISDEHGDSTEEEIILTVEPEDATPITYIGPLFVTTPSQNDPNATIPLQGILVDNAYDDNYRGNITHATATFFLVNNDIKTDINSTPIPVTQTTDLHNGFAMYNWNTSITGNDMSAIYTIGLKASEYYTGESEDYAVINLALPDGEFMTGGGTIGHKDELNPGYLGILGENADPMINFGFNTKYNKKGTNLQGKSTIIIRGYFDDDPELDHYQIKSNATDSLSVFSDFKENYKERATFLAKANLFDLDDEITLEGNLSLRVEVYDADKTVGITDDVDQFGINLTDSSDNLLFATGLLDAGLVTLTGGNVVIH
jgi:VCBS repeat-containing protein